VEDGGYALIRIGDLKLGPEERKALQYVIDREWLSEGPETRAFEDEFAAYVGTKYCIAVSSGTAALMCALTALKQDDRWHLSYVLLPALTFVADANAVSLCGLEPVFADVDPITFGLDMGSVAFGTHFDCVLPVHLMGYPVDWDYIVENVNYLRRGVPILEDACEAHGSSIGSDLCGSLGTLSVFSFYIAHTVQAGELGCICTNDPELAKSLRRIKAHGRLCVCRECTRNTTGCPYIESVSLDPRFLALTPGYNFKASEFQSAIARVQLRKIEENITRRFYNRLRLNELLSDVDELQLPPAYDNAVPMAYPMVLLDGHSRNSVLKNLTRRGVECRPLFGCIPTQQPAYAAYARSNRWPNAEWLGQKGFYVGCHQYLTDEDLELMAREIQFAVRESEEE